MVADKRGGGTTGIRFRIDRGGARGIDAADRRGPAGGPTGEIVFARAAERGTRAGVGTCVGAGNALASQRFAHGTGSGSSGDRGAPTEAERFCSEGNIETFGFVWLSRRWNHGRLFLVVHPIGGVLANRASGTGGVSICVVIA